MITNKQTAFQENTQSGVENHNRVKISSVRHVAHVSAISPCTPEWNCRIPWFYGSIFRKPSGTGILLFLQAFGPVFRTCIFVSTRLKPTISTNQQPQPTKNLNQFSSSSSYNAGARTGLRFAGAAENQMTPTRDNYNGTING